MNKKIENRTKRRNRIRKTIKGVDGKLRLSVYRSNTHIYAQLIDDTNAKTIAAASDLTVKIKGKKADIAKEIGKSLAQAALKKNVKEVVFDRGGYKYHGRIKALADGAREGGLIF